MVQRGARARRRKEGLLFLKKRSKKPLLLRPIHLTWVAASQRVTKQAKVFCFFFSKKKAFLPGLTH
jgi:hypothetical protein